MVDGAWNVLSRRCRDAVAATAILLSVSPAVAQGIALPGSQLVVGAGYGDVFQNKFGAGDFRFEYRSPALTAPLLGQTVGGRIWGGVEVMTNGFVWSGGGVLGELTLGRFVLIPQFGVGAYDRGSGKDLGATIEFRSAFEVAYQFQDFSRLGVSVSHTSNAGITRRNPGIEALTVNYQLPLANLLGSSR